MIDREPVIHVGVIQGAQKVRGEMRGVFRTSGGRDVRGPIEVWAEGVTVFVRDEHDAIVATGSDVILRGTDEGRFLLHDVTIGISFHWERKEDQVFEGNLSLIAFPPGHVTAVNIIGVEAYLTSVIASEMSATSPEELLKAHAITSRSWLVAMLERERREKKDPGASRRSNETPDEIVRWYDREDHARFDVCADDHCQRYQGVTKLLSAAAVNAVQATRGQLLIHGGEVCDARYYKACGGRTEEFRNAWEDVSVPYLHSVSDGPVRHPTLEKETEAERWMTSSPDAYCNTTDGNILRQVLPSFDQETTDFFRWKVEYSNDELAKVLLQKSTIDFGSISELIPLHRGPSGRITKLKIVGTKRTVTVGKELEIRKWLSKSHLYSSAFVVKKGEVREGVPSKFVLHGAGWGHGVGLCQIGAAVMATKGFSAKDIVLHYFSGAELKKLY